MQKHPKEECPECGKIVCEKAIYGHKKYACKKGKRKSAQRKNVQNVEKWFVKWLFADMQKTAVHSDGNGCRINMRDGNFCCPKPPSPVRRKLPLPQSPLGEKTCCDEAPLFSISCEKKSVSAAISSKLFLPQWEHRTLKCSRQRQSVINRRKRETTRFGHSDRSNEGHVLGRTQLHHNTWRVFQNFRENVMFKYGTIVPQNVIRGWYKIAAAWTFCEDVIILQSKALKSDSF